MTQKHPPTRPPYGSVQLTGIFGLWAVESIQFRGLVSMLNRTDLTAIATAAPTQRAERQRSQFEHSDGVAVIDLVGVMVKHPTLFGMFFQEAVTTEIRGQLRAAVDNRAIESIILHIDSPGGLVAGTADLAEEVRRAAGRKRTIAFIEDMGASGAYWVASQASKIFVNPTALVGSIGVLSVLVDESKLADRLGLKVIPVSTGFAKETGVPGAPITDEQIADLQRIVDAIFKQFGGAVMRGRRMLQSQFDAVSAGQVFVGEEAVRRGLADRIASFNDVVVSLRSTKPIRKALSTTAEYVRAQAMIPCDLEGRPL